MGIIEDNNFIENINELYKVDSFKLITNGKTLTLSNQRVSGKVHFCISVHYNNLIQGSYIEPRRIWNSSDNCKSCFLILNEK